MSNSVRSVLRVVGVVAMTLALVLIAVAMLDFFQAFNSTDSNAQPTKIWLFFIAVPCFAVGGFCLQAGFFGVASRYAAAEAMPAVRQSLSYLAPEDSKGAPVCPTCGAGTTVTAKFCEGCGNPVAATCGGCGAVNNAGAAFCTGCGATLAVP
jgi:hypothetical protein